MPTYKAVVQGGRIVIDNVDLEDGTEVELEVVNDNDVDEEQRRLDVEFDASIDDIEAGRTHPAEDVLAELRARR